MVRAVPPITTGPNWPISDARSLTVVALRPDARCVPAAPKTSATADCVIIDDRAPLPSPTPPAALVARYASTRHPGRQRPSERGHGVLR